jgi:hypothetical protein
MYQAYGLLLPESPFTLDAAGAKLAAAFPSFTMKQAAQQLSLLREDWEIHLVLEDGPEVAEEAQRIADGIGGDEDELGIRRCRRRVNVWTDIPDPEMEHFGDYIKILDVLKSFPGVVVVDPKEPSLL